MIHLHATCDVTDCPGRVVLKCEPARAELELEFVEGWRVTADGRDICQEHPRPVAT